MKNSNRVYALISGVAILIMALAAGYSFGYVYSNLVIKDNPLLTLTNLNNASGLFLNGVLGWSVILMTDLLVAWSLYKYFESVHPKISFATGLIRIVYSVVLALAIYHLVAVWQMLPASSQDETELLNLLNAFEKYWSLGLILFGFHLLGLGYLSLGSASVPKWIGWLLYLAGVSYVVIHLAKAISFGLLEIIATAEMILAVPMAIAEIGLAVWLIWKGGR